MLIVGLLKALSSALDNSQVREISSSCFRNWISVTESFEWAVEWDFIFSEASTRMMSESLTAHKTHPFGHSGS